jgi:drug/metabolite transporter (DMT)-like permease
MPVSQNIPFAIALGVIGSFCFALAARVQHSAVGEQVTDTHARSRLDFEQLRQLIRDRTWWMGLGLMGVSLVCQVLGLTMAPVSVVQPVGLLAFPWSVILARKTLGSRSSRIIAPTVITVLAVFAFVVVVAAHASSPEGLDLIPVTIAAGIVGVTAALFALMGSRGPRQWRSLFWASGGALFYGLEAALVKAIIEYSTSHEWWRDPMVWGIGIALVIGSTLAGLMAQQGYATGPAEVVVASMTVTSPVVAVVFGIAVLGEGIRLTLLPALSLILLGATAVLGVVALARVHPDHDATRPHADYAIH